MYSENVFEQKTSFFIEYAEYAPKLFIIFNTNKKEQSDFGHHPSLYSPSILQRVAEQLKNKTNMKHNITTTTPQTMTCAELDTYTKAHLGLRTTLTEPETVNTNPPFPLTQDTHLPTQITTPDGIYSDTKQKLQAKGINVTGTELIRLLWDDEDYKNLLQAKYPSLVSGISKEASNSITQGVTPNSAVKSIQILNYIPSITSLPNDCLRQGYGGYSSLTYIGLKYIDGGKNSGTWSGKYGGFNWPSYIKRAVLPSVTGILDYFFYASNSEVLIDLGPLVNGFGNNPANSSLHTTANIIILRNKSLGGNTYCVASKIFVEPCLLATYKSSDMWSSQSSKIFPIGGPTWASTFGSTDPYADLTPEEKSWYEDLFPTLYDGWQAPTED